MVYCGWYPDKCTEWARGRREEGSRSVPLDMKACVEEGEGGVDMLAAATLGRRARCGGVMLVLRT